MRPSPLPIAFAAFGVVWGAWQVVLPDLARHYDLGLGALGAMLSLGFAASLPAMLATGRLVDRFGLGTAIGTTAGTMAAGLLIVGLLPPLPVLVLAIGLFAAGSGAYDVVINGAGMGHPLWSRPARLTLLHAAFSGGGAVGAIGGGAILGAGQPFVWAYPAVAAVLALAAVRVARAGGHAPSAAGWAPRSVVMALVPLAGLAGLAFLAEGSMETWSAIYLRAALGAAAFVGALGPAAFHAAMFAGRLVGAGVAALLGASQTLLVAGGLTVVGMAAALLVPVPPVAIGGMAVAALGASFVVPVVVSLASRRAGPHAGSGASVVLTLGYAGFLIGPSLVGLLAEVAGLRVALAVVPVGAAVIALASRTRLVR